jgi:hypothetical protein
MYSIAEHMSSRGAAEDMHQLLQRRRLWEKNVARESATAAQPAFWVAAYPEAGLTFNKILNTADVAAVTKVSDFPVHYFPFDKDVLSMHRPEVVKELLTDSNPASLSETARVCPSRDLETALLHLRRF